MTPVSDDKAKIEGEIREMEAHMAEPNFWSDKRHADEVIARYNELKAELLGVGKYDKGNAIVTIFAGAGGDDAEDFAQMLFNMYDKYISKRGWGRTILHENQNSNGGYRNITFEIVGKGPYGILKGESGVHRLVRISPFNANKKRHTSFAMVEVIPKLEEVKDFEISEDDIKWEFAKSGGPGGQNVNKRETAVRVVHVPSGLSAHVSTERSQGQNRERALGILRGKLFKLREENRAREEAGLKISKTTQVEWGNQIRSYVLHPYQMIKDHRTGVEVRDVERVLAGGIEAFLQNDQIQ